MFSRDDKLIFFHPFYRRRFSKEWEHANYFFFEETHHRQRMPSSKSFRWDPQRQSFDSSLMTPFDENGKRM